MGSARARVYDVGAVATAARRPEGPGQTGDRFPSALCLCFVRRTRIQTPLRPCGPLSRPQRQNETRMVEKEKKEKEISLSPETIESASCRSWWRPGAGDKDGYPSSHCDVCGPGEKMSLSSCRLGELRSPSQKSSWGNMGEGVRSRGGWKGVTRTSSRRWWCWPV